MADKELLLQKLTSLKQHLLNVVTGDGQVTIDERNLMNAINYSVVNIERAIDDVFEDGIVTEDEKVRLNSLVKQLGDDAITVSEFDESVTAEEEAILLNLQATLENLQENIKDL